MATATGSHRVASAVAFTAALAVSTAPVFALDPGRSLTQYMHDVWKWSPALGAPFGTITALGQTPEGYLLIGTDSDGLLRFDGVRFVRDAEFDRLRRLNGYRLEALASDAAGTLWAATPMGVARLSHGTWTTTLLPPGPVGLALDVDGDLLVAARQGGLIRSRGGASETLTREDSTSVAAGAGREVWVGVGSPPHGLLRIRGREITRLGKKDGLAGDQVLALDFGPSANLWVATRGGINRVHDGRIAQTITRRDGLPSDDTTAVLEDREGSVWVGTGADGIARLRDGRIESFGKAQGFPGGAVTAFYEDREGSLWFATSDTLSRLRAGPILPYGEAEGLGLDRATSIVEGRDGSVWVWSDGGGLSQIKNGRVTRVFTTRDGLATNFGGSLFESRDGAIWVGNDRGLSRFKDGRATAYQGGRLGGTYFPMITEDAEGMITWVFGMGLVRFRDGKVAPYPLKAGSTTEEMPMPFMARWTRDGTLWLGTAKGAWTLRDGVLKKVWDLDTGLSMVMDIHEDSAGAIWLATTEGIYRFQGGSVSAITTEQGLPINRLTHLLEDGLGYFWVGSHYGILRIKKRELEDVAAGRRKRVEPELFGTADGMRTAEVNPAAQPNGCAARDGRLWFATRAGAVVIDPADLRRNARPPPVVIEDVVADGRSRGAAPGIRLEAGTIQLEVHYTALSLLAPDRVRFKFRLEGLDRDWVEAAGRRVANYSHLRAGVYRFQVIAANNDGVWNDVGASLGLEQLPHFYERRVFFLALGLVLLGAVVGVHRLRVRHHIRRVRVDQINEQLEQRVRERTAELEQANRVLFESETRFRMLVEGATDYAILMLDPEGRVASWNAGAERLKGFSADEIIGQHFSRFYPEEDIALGKPARELETAASEGRLEDEGWRVRKDGSRFWAHFVITALRDETGQLRGFAKLTRDLTRRRQADIALARSEERFAALIEFAPDAMVISNAGGEIVLVNGQTERLFGYRREELLGQPVEILMPERFRERHPGHRSSYLASPEVRAMGPGMDLHGLRKDGTEFPIEVALGPLETEEGRLVSSEIRDITERCRSELMLRQSQRVEAIGLLAGGVAHDFNNILGIITGYGELAQRQLTDHPARARVDEMVKAAERAASLTRQLLAFSRKQVMQPRLLDLNRIVADTQKMLGRLIGEDVQLVIRAAPGLGTVKGRSRPDRADHPESRRERSRRDAERRQPDSRDRQRRPRQRLRHRPSTSDAGAVRDAGDLRHGHGHGPEDAASDLRTILHDQARG